MGNIITWFISNCSLMQTPEYPKTERGMKFRRASLLWKLPAPRIAAASHPAEAGAAAQISNPQCPCQAPELISGWLPYQRWMKRSGISEWHMTRTPLLKSTSMVTCNTKSSSSSWHSLPEGFFLGHCHVELSWPQASREELKVSSQKVNFCFRHRGKSLGAHPESSSKGQFCLICNFFCAAQLSVTCQEDTLIPPNI